MTTPIAPAAAAPPLSDLELEIALLHKPAIDLARKMIVWAGILYPVQAVLFFAMLARYVGTGVFATSAFAIVLGIALAVMGVHLLLAWWAKKQPFPATSVAFAIDVAYIIALTQDAAPGNLIVPLICAFILGRAVLASYRAYMARARGSIS